MNHKITSTFAFIILFSLSFMSSLVIDDVEQEDLYPGQNAKVVLSVENNLGEDVEDVSVILNIEGTGFTTSGSTEDSEDEIDDDDKEKFSFVIKAPANMKAGDYNIPYSIKYVDNSDEEKTKSGSFGIKVSAETELSYDAELENNIIGSKGKVLFKVVNSGLGDIGFVSVEILSVNGFEILGTNKEYIGSVSSDDFEVANFRVLFRRQIADLTASVTYKDFENNEHTETVTLPVKVYTREQALEIGLIQKSKVGIYVGIAVLIVGWFIYRKWRKARRAKKRKEEKKEA